uniref:DUF7642 domain-containing protein n=2 Tax=Kalanchoe fedtschenkoi TaxID=63787 RepID=A0A7N0SZ79_KALFE
MLMGHADSLMERASSRELLLSGPDSDIEEDISGDISEQIIYTASFDELASSSVQYDTIIWVSISLLLVLAWGFGIIMLLYLPFRRYVMRKDILSRKLYVTPTEIVYKVSRPSFIPFWGAITIERHVPLARVIDIIIEQGCLQSVYGIHTLRVESIAQGKAAPVDELQIQGVANPGILTKVIITEASKAIQEAGQSWKPTPQFNENQRLGRFASLNEGPASLKSPSKNWKMTGSPRVGSVERRAVPGELLLNKIEEVNKTVKKLEFLIEKTQPAPETE